MDPYDSPLTSPYSSPNNPFPHSLPRTSQSFQSFQNPSVKDYTLHHIRDPTHGFKAHSLVKGFLEGLGIFSRNPDGALHYQHKTPFRTPDNRDRV